jgi:plastocyanin
VSSRLKAVALLAAVGFVSAQCGGGARSATGERVSAGGISPASSSAEATSKVEIKEYKYIPETLHVKVGSVVRWTNFDNVGHTVTFTAADTGPKRPIRSRAEIMELNRPTELYSSRLFDAKETFTVRFDRAGRFKYICDPHPYMKAVVIVE